MKRSKLFLSSLILMMGLTSWGCNTPTEPVGNSPITSPTNPPTVNLIANPTSIQSGQNSTLSWTSTNATSCVGIGFNANTTFGSLVVNPVVTTTYKIVATGPGGNDTATVTVVIKEEIIAVGNGYHGGTIFYVDSTGKHGLYVIVIPIVGLQGLQDWNTAMQTAKSMGGNLPTKDQFKNYLYPQKDLLGITGEIYWSQDELSAEQAGSLVFNLPNQPEFNGEALVALKIMLNGVLVLCSF